MLFQRFSQLIQNKDVELTLNRLFFKVLCPLMQRQDVESTLFQRCVLAGNSVKIVQESKQEVTKVVSLIINGKKVNKMYPGL